MSDPIFKMANLIDEANHNHIKIQGGTPRGGASLCLSCKHASIVRGQNMEERIVCQMDLFGRHMQVPFRVAECRDYEHVNMPSLNDMKQIAWEVVARKRGDVGFAGGVTKGNENELEIIVRPPSKKDNTDSEDD